MIDLSNKVENSESATIEEHFNVISSLDIETATYRSETLLNYLMWRAPKRLFSVCTISVVTVFIMPLSPVFFCICPFAVYVDA